MSTTFELRTSKKVGYATVQVRVQSSILGVNIRISTGKNGARIIEKVLIK